MRRMHKERPTVLFMGTPTFASDILRHLLMASVGHVVAVVTQPDQPTGRMRRMMPSPVKQLALENTIPVMQPTSLRDPEIVRWVRSLAPQWIVTAAYGRLLPQEWLTCPSGGCINVHASLLPAYRGAAPVQRALMEGCLHTGVTLMHMIAQMDAGDIIAQKSITIADEDDTGSLLVKLGTLGGQLLVECFPALFSQTAMRVMQDETLATYAPKVTRADERIDFQLSALQLHNRLRALSPAPGMETMWRGQPFKVRASIRPDDDAPVWREDVPGTVVAMHDRGIDVVAGDGRCWTMTIVQPAGKKPLAVADFLRGARIQIGERFGEDTQHG